MNKKRLRQSTWRSMTKHFIMVDDKIHTGRPKKLHLTLTLCSEAVTTIMLGISSFPVSPDLYNSFDTLLICFHDLMNKWKWVIFQTWICSKLEFYRISVISYPRTCCFQARFGNLLVGLVTRVFSQHFILSINVKVLRAKIISLYACDAFL